MESRAHDRAEELAGTQEGAVSVCKVNFSFSLFGHFTNKNYQSGSPKG